MSKNLSPLAVASVLLTSLLSTSGLQAGEAVQIGSSGKTFASALVMCVTQPDTLELMPAVTAGLFNPTASLRGQVSLNGVTVASVNSRRPSATVWLTTGDNAVVVALSKRLADSYSFNVQADVCALPDTSGNTFSSDGSLELAASGKSSATVEPGCAFNPASGLAQPFINLFDSGNYLLNVSNNGVALTQLSSTHPSTPVFLGPGLNIISAANGFVSTDYYVREGGDGLCTLP